MLKRWLQTVLCADQQPPGMPPPIRGLHRMPPPSERGAHAFFYFVYHLRFLIVFIGLTSHLVNLANPRLEPIPFLYPTLESARCPLKLVDCPRKSRARRVRAPGRAQGEGGAQGRGRGCLRHDRRCGPYPAGQGRGREALSFRLRLRMIYVKRMIARTCLFGVRCSCPITITIL